MSRIITAKKSAILILAVLLILLALSFSPFGSDGNLKALKEKTILFQQLGELNSLPPAIGEKISPQVRELAAEALYNAAIAKSRKEASEKRKIEFLVKSSGDISGEVGDSGGKIVDSAKSLDGTSEYSVVKVDADKVAEFASKGSVVRIIPNIIFHTTLDESVPLIKADAFWNAGHKGNGVKVAVVDTGIDETHPLLQGKVAAERDFTETGNADDICGHGTHVAGIIAGTKANGGLYDGVAPEAQLINVKALTMQTDGSCGGEFVDILKGINWALDPDANPATDDGAKVISMSLGAPFGIESYTDFDSELKAIAAKGVIVVVSSGNCGSGCPSIGSCGSFRGVTFPGSSSSVITVGAVDKSKGVACFSSGESISGVGIKPDVVAPGVGIKSSVPGNSYAALQGTSMAAPHVSGAVALLLGRNPVLKPDEVRRILEKTSVDLGDIGKDASYGFGLIDLGKALIYREGIEFTIEMERLVISGDTQGIKVAVFDDVPIKGVSAVVTKPNGAKTPSLPFASIGSNSFSHDFTETDLLGNYIVDVAVEYGGSGESGGIAGTSGSGTSTLTVMQTASFKVTSLTGDFGNLEGLNLSAAQFLSANFTANLTFLNTAAMELNFSALLQLYMLSGDVVEAAPSMEVRLPALPVAANSRASAYANSGLNLAAGNYALRILTDYGAGSIVNETNLTIIDDLPPAIAEVDYSSHITGISPQTFLMRLSEHGGISAVALSVKNSEGAELPVNYTVAIKAGQGSDRELAVTLFDTDGVLGPGGYEAVMAVCDEHGNCANSGPLGFEVAGCDGRKVLVVKTYDAESSFESAALAQGGLCLAALNRSIAGTPPSAYLERFNAVIWTTATDVANIDSADAAAIVGYYGKGGKVLVEGSDVAFRHGNDELMGSVLHASLDSDLGFTVTSTDGLDGLSLVLAMPHPVVAGLGSPLPFNVTEDPFPDSVTPYNGSVVLAAWNGTSVEGPAIVAYESGDGKSKSLFLPFYIGALGRLASEAVAANALKWLLEDSTVDVAPLEIKYGGEYPLIPKEVGPVCAMVCTDMWKLDNGECSFTSCGSGCGPDNTTTFAREDECKLAKQYYESGSGSSIIVEGNQFTATALVGSSENLASPLKVKVLIDGGANGASEGEAALVPATGSSYSYNFSAQLKAGQHTVTVFSNSDFSISERNYVNNVKDFTLAVYPSLPDLLVSGIAYSYNEAGSSIELSVNVTNLGGAAAESDIAAYLDGNEAASHGFSVGIGGIAEVKMPLAAGKGAYGLKLVVDGGNSVAEFNDTNNEFSETIYLCSRENVLVVDDNTAEFFSTPEPASADEFLESLRLDGYCARLWDKSRHGSPSSADIAAYSAVVWAAGDYFNGTLNENDRNALAAYSGGLLIEGSDIGMDNAGEELFASIVGVGFGSDMIANETPEELVLREHALTQNLAALSISREKSPYPDSVEPGESSYAVAEWQDGTAAIVAYNGTGRNVAYYAFSVDGIAGSGAMRQLVANTLNWILAPARNKELLLDVPEKMGVNENGTVTIKAEARYSSGGSEGIVLSVNDSRFVLVNDKQSMQECGGLAGKSCDGGLFCVVPAGCVDCYGACHAMEDSHVEFFEWFAGFGDAGRHEIMVAAEGGGLAAEKVVLVDVANINQKPVFEAQSHGEPIAEAMAVTMYEGQEKNFSILASDPDGDPLTYTWLLNGTLVSESQNFTFKPGYKDSGNYNLTIIVSDGQDEARLEITIIVIDVNRPAVIKGLIVSSPIKKKAGGK